MLAGCAVEDRSGAPAGNSQAALGGAQAQEDYDENLVELTEKLYVTYINEIYTNYPDYIGRTIRLQGMFASEYYQPNDTTYFYVYRIGPGCCGNDGDMCGFEFTWDGQMPADNDWIEVTGTLDEYELDGQTYLTLKAAAVEKQAQRGSEMVYQ